MPLIAHSDYRSPAWLFNSHLQTIIPSTFRRVEGVRYQRERLELPDGDFVDLDWSRLHQSTSRRLVIISHGLEGNSYRPYVKGMVRAFNQAGWDALAWNCRSCSGEMNRLPRFYHHADTADLRAVVNHVSSDGKYEEISLIGFSMGGCMTLKLLGESGELLPPTLRRAVAFSVPCDLPTSVERLSSPNSTIYRRRFLRKLQRKIHQKSQLLPDQLTYQFDDIRVFRDFDNRYTAPLHGFRDADDFYDQASVRHHLAGIRIPTLLVNAANDPFLTPLCYPVQEATQHPYLYLEIPQQGGHVGFSLSGEQNTWSEKRALDFVSAAL